MTNAYKYLMDVGGIQEDDSYPYTGKRGDCKFNPEKAAVKVLNFTNIPIDEEQIAAHLVHHGPLAVGLNAIFMQTYIGGVSCPLICGKMGEPRRVTRGLRFERLLYPQAWKPALLDHQELLGNQVGRARLLSPLQGTGHVRNEHDGLRCDDSNLVKK